MQGSLNLNGFVDSWHQLAGTGIPNNLNDNFNQRSGPNNLGYIDYSSDAIMNMKC